MPTVRKALMADVPHIHRLVNDYAQQGIMLRRPLMMLYENVRDFAVAEIEGQVVGVCGLHVLWHDLAEVRSLAVHPSQTGKGLGRALVNFLVVEAEAIGLRRVFALTYQQAFFASCGFAVIKKETLPQKVWKECINCSKFNACDEIAMIRHVQPALESAGPEADGEVIEIPLWVIE